MDLVFYLPIDNFLIPNFLKQHPELETTLSRAIETSRITTIIKPAMHAFFSDYQAILTEHQIEAQNTYNMDETDIF